jgi:hypothetical protein
LRDGNGFVHRHFISTVTINGQVRIFGSISLQAFALTSFIACEAKPMVFAKVRTRGAGSWRNRHRSTKC